VAVARRIFVSPQYSIAFADRYVRVLKGAQGERQLFAANPL